MTATMSETAARKMKSGRLYKKFDTDISNSRVSEQVQTQYSSLKPNIAGHIVNSEARNAQARTKFSSTMGCQKTNNDNEFEKEGVNQKSFFRVKRQGKPGLLMHLSHRYDNLPAATKGAEQ